jgi:uncharacterized membrane protein YphA (DoxX/SURF4 family)
MTSEPKTSEEVNSLQRVPRNVSASRNVNEAESATVFSRRTHMAQSTSRGVGILAVILGVMMIGSGLSKLGRESHQVVMFAQIGLPHWFLALVGTFEVIGGILLATPASRPAGSLILSTIMVGAFWAHAAQGEWVNLVPVSVLLVLLLLIFQRNRPQALHLLGSAA